MKTHKSLWVETPDLLIIALPNCKYAVDSYNYLKQEVSIMMCKLVAATDIYGKKRQGFN